MNLSEFRPGRPSDFINKVYVSCQKVTNTPKSRVRQSHEATRAGNLNWRTVRCCMLDKKTDTGDLLVKYACLLLLGCSYCAIVLARGILTSLRQSFAHFAGSEVRYITATTPRTFAFRPPRYLPIIITQEALEKCLLALQYGRHHIPLPRP